MTEAALEHCVKLKHEIEHINNVICRITPYDSTDITITIYKRNGCGSDNGEIKLCEFHQDRYNDDIVAAMKEVLLNYREDLIHEFESIKGEETKAKIAEMPPIGLWERLWNKWNNH